MSGHVQGCGSRCRPGTAIAYAAQIRGVCRQLALMDALNHPQVDTAHYTYRVSWSAEDGDYVATCLEFPSLSWLAKSRGDAIDGLERIVVEAAEHMDINGEEVPQPLSERKFSGTFNVRIGAHLHRDLVMHAAEERMSLNQYVVRKLASS